jgi:hypothetical protein
MKNNSFPTKIDKSVGLDFSDELKTYLLNKFSLSKKKSYSTFQEEPSINFWKISLKKIFSGEDAFVELKKCYPQLNFPIETGIEKSEFYKNLVLKGKTDCINITTYLKLTDSKSINLKLHESIAGRIPILTISNKEDFTSIIQSLLYKNNPITIPVSMGAVLINGINNWERLYLLKIKWLGNNPLGDWTKEFYSNIVPYKSLYKDKLIVLSTKPYSNVSASQLGLPDDLWISQSIAIRQEHECTHLYTLKRYGQASNNLHDELIADYIGIIKTIGYYNKEWMLLFMGLEAYPKYREGARLENYVKESSLSSEDFRQLTTIVKNAIENIAVFDETLGKLESNKDQMCRIEALCETGLVELASQNGATLLIQNYYENFKLETAMNKISSYKNEKVIPDNQILNTFSEEIENTK